MRPLTVGSLFAGIGGFDLGFERAGFTVAWRCEIDPFCQRVLRAYVPCVPIVDDVRTITATTVPPVDVLVGGFPCQDLSVAGQRQGLHGDRSSLFFEFVRVLHLLRPRWMVLENVPGFLSSAHGHDFAHALDQLDACGYVGSWRVLDSQYFGLAQRRQRVFLVARPRECGHGAQTVLFESEGGAGNFAAGDEARPDVAACLRGRAHGASSNEPGRGGEDDVNLVYALRENDRNTSQGPANYIPVMAACLNPGHEAKHTYAGDGGTLNLITESGERERALVGSMHKRHDDDTDTLIPTLDTSLGHHGGSLGVGDFLVPTLTGNLGHHGYGSDRGDGSSVVVGSLGMSKDAGGWRCGPDEIAANQAVVAYALNASHGTQLGQGHNTTYPTTATGVRRLTPLECERLQGFPDYREIAIISVCSDPQKSYALADSRSRKWLPSVCPVVGDDYAHRVRTAERNLNESRLNAAWPVAWRVLIDSERVQVLCGNRGKSLWSVNAAARYGSFLLPTEPADFARLVAVLRHDGELRIPLGAVASPTNDGSSLVQRNGILACSVSGFVTSALASDAERLTNTVSACLRGITSSDGRTHPDSDWYWTTWCSCVVATISTFIPDATHPERSFDLSLETPISWTCLCGDGHRGTQYCTCPDTPRYKALGNAVSVPVAQWIAERILMAERGQ